MVRISGEYLALGNQCPKDIPVLWKIFNIPQFVNLPCFFCRVWATAGGTQASSRFCVQGSVLGRVWGPSVLPGNKPWSAKCLNLCTISLALWLSYLWKENIYAWPVVNPGCTSQRPLEACGQVKCHHSKEGRKKLTFQFPWKVVRRKNHFLPGTTHLPPEPPGVFSEHRSVSYPENPGCKGKNCLYWMQGEW